MTRTDPNSPQTPEKTPSDPQERPEGGLAALASSGALNGAQTGADAVWGTASAHSDDIAAVQSHYQRAAAAEETLARYRDWLATQHANAVRADQAQGPVPDHLKISPHNGIAAGLKTALLGLDRHLHPHNVGPTVRECAEADRRWWNGEKTGE